VSKSKGVVAWFNDKKGYGFIVHNDVDIFVHFSDVAKEGYKTLNAGDRVTFDKETSERGLCAKCVAVVH